MSWPSLLLGVLSLQIGPVTPGVPCKQPQLAATRDLAALVFGCGSTIYFSSSRDAGHTWSAPVTVAETKLLALGRHRGPRVAIAGQTIVVSAVVGGPQQGDLLAWRSTDQGRTWSAPTVVNDVPRAAREGLHAMAADGNGNLFAVWLDLRQKGTRLYGARSSAAGAAWSGNVLVYESPGGTICQCCHPTVQIDAGGTVWVMWRNALDGFRDMYVARSSDGARFGKAEKLGNGSWELKACPMDGGGLALKDGRAVSVWRRDKTVFLAAPGEAERALGAGKDAAVAAGGRGVYAAWSDGPALRAWLPGKTSPVTLAGRGAYPVLAATPGRAPLAAWEDDGAIHIQPLQ